MRSRSKSFTTTSTYVQMVRLQKEWVKFREQAIKLEHLGDREGAEKAQKKADEIKNLVINLKNLTF